MDTMNEQRAQAREATIDLYAIASQFHTVVYRLEELVASGVLRPGEQLEAQEVITSIGRQHQKLCQLANNKESNHNFTIDADEVPSWSKVAWLDVPAF
jgi:hypothetical protein